MVCRNCQSAIYRRSLKYGFSWCHVVTYQTNCKVHEILLKRNVTFEERIRIIDNYPEVAEPETRHDKFKKIIGELYGDNGE